jgi:hypothetical protein
VRPRAISRVVAFAICSVAFDALAQTNAHAGPVAATATAEMAAYTDSDSVTVFTPAASAVMTDESRGWRANGAYLADIVSAASVDIVSTASQRWQEVRHGGELGGMYKPHDVGLGVDTSVSSEPDYLSLSAGARVLLDTHEKTANPTFGYAYTHDTAGRTGTPFSVYAQRLQRHSLNAGVELVLDRATTLNMSLDVNLERGDQKKPYRMLPIFEADVVSRVPAGASLATVNLLRSPGRMTEKTPLERNRFALSARFAHRFSGSTFLLSDRLYADDWGLFAFTTDVRYVIDVGRRFYVWLHFRGNLQSGVSFWQRAYVGATGDGTSDQPTYRTGDRELSPLESATGGAGVRWNFGAAPRSSRWGLVVQGDTIATHFRDALYVTDRVAQLFVLQVETEL